MSTLCLFYEQCIKQSDLKPLFFWHNNTAKESTLKKIDSQQMVARDVMREMGQLDICVLQTNKKTQRKVCKPTCNLITS